jgi:acetaldehyde dehydrogenase
MKKARVAIIGTGNIGTDLLLKVMRSKVLECALFSGRSSGSRGIQKARSLGVPVSQESIDPIEKHPDSYDIVFDATTSVMHIRHAELLKRLGIFTIDLTPSRVGKMCVPSINIGEILKEPNVNLVTCGGQASIPIAYAICRVHPETEYIEVSSSIASKSAGPGTRANIDEYVQTTQDAIRHFSGVRRSKAILVLNPAEPPVHTHNTIFAEIANPDIPRLTEAIAEVVRKIQRYVPGYKLILGPVAEMGRVTVINQVDGAGDFLPEYAGNLDIITCAAVNVAEEYARRVLKIQAKEKA